MAGGPHHAAVSRDGSRLYVVSQPGNNVSVIDTATGQVIATIPVGVRPEGVAITPDGKAAFVAVRVSAYQGRLDRIDLTTNTVTGSISLNGLNGPKEIAITPDGTRAYVTFETDRTVAELALATNQVVATVPVGTPTIGISVSPVPLSSPSLGDVNGDGSIDQTDLTQLLLDRNKTVSASACGLRCDLDGDGTITVLDGRILVGLCSRSGCTTK